MARILSAGLAVVDFVFQLEDMPARPQKYRASDAAISRGGCATNAAVAIARLGGEALLATRLGDDAVSDIILDSVVSEGIDVSMIHRSDGGFSAFSSVYLDREGERQIVHFPGKGLVEDTEWLDGSESFDAVLADNMWPPLARAAIALGRKRGVPVVVDAEAPATLSHVTDATHIAFSMQGLNSLKPDTKTADALREIATDTGAWVCVTDGANGVFSSTDRRWRTFRPARLRLSTHSPRATSGTERSP